MIITLIRHTALNISPGICYGQTDVDVSDTFAQELTGLTAKLSPYQFDAIYASPLQRCTKLAEALSAAIQLSQPQVVTDDRLKELHFGDWEMREWDSIPRELFDVWANDYANLAPPNGESFSQLQNRAQSFVAEVGHHAHQHICVVTHGGFIRALIAAVLELPLKRLFRMQIDYASVTQITMPNTALDNIAVPKIHFMNR